MFDETASTHTLATTTLMCIECRRPWLEAAERWRLLRTEDEVPELVPYCAECAAFEFGSD